MNAVAIKYETEMDWGKRTFEEWLKQYGAYIAFNRMRGGNRPDDLSISQIYWFGTYEKKSARGEKIFIEISDYEAEEVRKMIASIVKSKYICYSAKIATQLFIAKHVRGMSLSQMEDEFTMSRSSINNMVYAGKFYLNGHDKRLRID